MHAVGRSKKFGEQVCVLVLDVWWGWIDDHFRAAVKAYSWLRLVFVPGSCTPVGQPLDAGIIAIIKSLLRELYGTWACALTISQLKSGTAPSNVTLPLDGPAMRNNLLMWICSVVTKINNSPEYCEKLLHCWRKTTLLRAWEPQMQLEAVREASRLFGGGSSAEQTAPVVIGATCNAACSTPNRILTLSASNHRS